MKLYTNQSFLYYTSIFFLLQKEETAPNEKEVKTPKEMKKYLTASGPQSVSGHTGFLTFATLPPKFLRQ